MFDANLELLFGSPEVEITTINLDLVYPSKYYFDPAVLKQNRCKQFPVVRHSCELAIVLSEVWVRILLNEIISVVDDILKCHASGTVYDINSRKEKKWSASNGGCKIC